jgi:WNK lysine deficient protein kinase
LPPAEIRVLSALNHRNIITCYDWWHDAPSETVNFITELFTSGTLRQ